MKGVKVSLIMLSVFAVSQLLGLFVNAYYLDTEELPLGMQHSDFEKEQPVLAVFTFILIATAALLIIIRLGLWKVWKAWFFIAMTVTVAVFLSVFLEGWTALLVAGILSFIRIYEEDDYFSNLMNVLMFSAIGALFAPIFSVFTIIVFMVVISAYDFVSVFMTKHIVSIARASGEQKGLFPGLVVKWKGESLVLGGGDVALPLIFQGVVLSSSGMVPAFLSVYGAVLGLALLLFLGKKKKFYPAMPFITAGLLVSYWLSKGLA